MEEDIKVPTLYIDRVDERAHLDRVYRERDQVAMKGFLDNLRHVA